MEANINLKEIEQNKIQYNGTELKLLASGKDIREGGRTNM